MSVMGHGGSGKEVTCADIDDKEFVHNEFGGGVALGAEVIAGETGRWNLDEGFSCAVVDVVANGGEMERARLEEK